jgi:hypothetical protein
MWWVPCLLVDIGTLDRRCGLSSQTDRRSVLTKVLADGLDDDVHARRRDDTIRGLDDREIVPKSDGPSGCT